MAIKVRLKYYFSLVLFIFNSGFVLEVAFSARTCNHVHPKHYEVCVYNLFVNRLNLFILIKVPCILWQLFICFTVYVKFTKDYKKYKFTAIMTRKFWNSIGIKQFFKTISKCCIFIYLQFRRVIFTSVVECKLLKTKLGISIIMHLVFEIINFLHLCSELPV